MRILLIGPPGVGKGTQAARLQAQVGAVPLASGDIFRSELKHQTELGRLAQSYMDKGELVPDDVTIRMMAGRLDDPKVRECGFILDGFPRTVAQAGALEKTLEEMGLPLDAVVSLEVEDEVVVRRLSGRRTCLTCGQIYHVDSSPPRVEDICDNCGSGLDIRPDDNPDTIRERLKVFHAFTEPVVAWYENKGLLRRIDGSASPEQVFDSILSALSERAR